MNNKRFFFGIKHYKSFFYFLMISSYLCADIPETLNNQNNINISMLDYKYKQVKKSKIHYIYDSYGNKTVILNFNQYGNLLTKTYYKILDKNKNVYITDDNCKNVDCYFFIH